MPQLLMIGQARVGFLPQPTRWILGEDNFFQDGARRRFDDAQRLRCSRSQSLALPAAVSDFELSEALGRSQCIGAKAAPGRGLFCYTSWRACRLRISPWRNVCQEGLSVYVPLFFGEPGQNRFFAGYFQSCAQADFEYSALSTSSPITVNYLKVRLGAANRPQRMN